MHELDIAAKGLAWRAAALSVCVLLAAAAVNGSVAAGVKGPVEKISDMEFVNYFGLTGEGGKPLTFVCRLEDGGWEDVIPANPEHIREQGAIFGYRVAPEKPRCESYVIVDIRSLGDAPFERFVERYLGTVSGKGAKAQIEDPGEIAMEIRSRGKELARGPSPPQSYRPLRKYRALLTEYAFPRSADLVDPVHLWLAPMEEKVLMFSVEDMGTNANVSKLRSGFEILKRAPPTNVDLPIKYDVVTRDGSHDEKVCGVLPKALSMVRVFEREDYGEDVFGLWVARDDESAEVVLRLTLKLVDPGVNAAFEDHVAQHVASLRESLPDIEEQSGDGLFANVHGRWFRGVSGGADGKVVHEVVTRNPVGTQPARFVQHWTFEILAPATEQKVLKSFRKFLKSLHGWVRAG